MSQRPLRSPLLALCLFAAACSHTARGRDDGGAPGPASDLSAAPGPEPDLFGGCASASYTAMQSPAAMLVLLDRSSSMAMNNKYAIAAQDIVGAIDQNVFDSMSLGLLAAPSGTEAAPACLDPSGLGLVQVACIAPPFPQISLAPAGMNKSTAPTGVRHDIKAWLASNSPDTSQGDATPLYDAIQNALTSLQGWAVPGKRILFIVTDGTIDCTVYSNRTGFTDCNGCNDWENPQNIITLLKTANQDPNAPVDTFIVGLPGADTTKQDCSGCGLGGGGTCLDNPPYSMRLALSAMAYAGSPNNVPANCTGKAFTQAGTDPTVSCHVDLTRGNFQSQAIANTISQVRGKVLGCTYELPMPDGGMVDPNDVNVTYTVGGSSVTLTRRSDPTNQCLTSGCWDYDASGKVQLIGKACTDVTTGTNVDVQIVVGCPTVIG